MNCKALLNIAIEIALYKYCIIIIIIIIIIILITVYLPKKMFRLWKILPYLQP